MHRRHTAPLLLGVLVLFAAVYPTTAMMAVLRLFEMAEKADIIVVGEMDAKDDGQGDATLRSIRALTWRKATEGGNGAAAGGHP